MFLATPDDSRVKLTMSLLRCTVSTVWLRAIIMSESSSEQSFSDTNDTLFSLAKSLKYMTENLDIQQCRNPSNKSSNIESFRLLVSSLTALRCRLNLTASPILYLPPEVLVRVFEHAIPLSPFDGKSPQSNTDMPSILKLSHVSRAFHNTALSFPHLWSQIFLDHRNVALQELFLSRSGQGNLFLYVHHLTRFSKPLLVNLLIRSANRIQELYFGADVELSSSTIDSLSSPFPNLRKFHCFDPGLNPISLTPIPLLDILAAQTPILSHLGLSKFGFWPSAAQLIHLRSLRTLHFNRTPKNMLEIPLVDVLSTLGVLPRLVELRFASPAFVITSGSYKVTANQVRLFSLKSLDFIDCFPSTSFLLLSHLMLSHRVKVLILHPRSRTSYQPANIASIFDLLPLSFFLSMRFNQIDIRSRHHQLPFSFGNTGRVLTIYTFGIQKYPSSPYLEVSRPNEYILNSNHGQKDFNPLSWLAKLSNLKELSIGLKTFKESWPCVSSPSFTRTHGEKLNSVFAPILVEDTSLSSESSSGTSDSPNLTGFVVRSPRLRRFSIHFYTTCTYWMKDFEGFFKMRSEAGGRELELVSFMSENSYPEGIDGHGDLKLSGVKKCELIMRNRMCRYLPSVVESWY
ncbi:hypothetical protein ABKN59_009852 [Abortiporus biennis]